jgi:hypothetical protein
MPKDDNTRMLSYPHLLCAMCWGHHFKPDVARSHVLALNEVLCGACSERRR